MTPPRSVALLAACRAVAAALSEEVERDLFSRRVDVLLKQLLALATATVAAAREELDSRRPFRNKSKQRAARLGSRQPAAELSAWSKSTGRRAVAAPGRRRPRRQGGF
jgi:hypothetical protein